MPAPLRSTILLTAFLGLARELPAELPLPDATFYGTITTAGGAPVTSGTLQARVKRGATAVLTATGAFKQDGGTFFYVVRVPLESNIGAPGPSGSGAHEGDTLDALVLNGSALELKTAVGALKAGGVARVDATAPDGAGGPRFVRGDCSEDQALDISDAVRILTFLFISPGDPPCLDACDADGTGVLEITDGVFLLAYLYLGGPTPPVPGATCGTAPSPTGLGCVNTVCP
jgi:hypothetical protein